MSWKILKNDVRGERGNICSLPFAIKQAVEVRDVLLIVLDVPPKISMNENVMAISRDCDILWKIQKISETANDPVNCYVEIVSVGENSVRIGSWNGVVVEVDVKTGKINSSQFLK